MSAVLAVALAGRIGPDFTLDVAFALPATGIAVLLGPSGSGKTSVLRAVAGLDRLPGEVRLGGATWQDARTFVPAHRRRVGWVAQGGGLLPHLTVAGNLAYAARRGGAAPFDGDDIVARTGLAPLLTRSPARLSGGEAQRASIARALLGQPHLLLMDEPLTGLDTAARAALADELAALFAALPLPVLYVTHDAAEARRLAATTLVIDRGRIAGGA